jgi:hypothetical protein
MGDPPVVPAEKFTVACWSPATAVLMVGAPGIVAGITALLLPEAGPVPMAFVAVTLKVYEVPFVSPVMEWVRPVVPAFASVPPAGFDVTV